MADREKMPKELKLCTTPDFRLSFAHVFKPTSFKGQPENYSIVMLFPEKTDFKTNYTKKGKGVSMHQALLNAAIDKWGEKDAKRMLANKELRLPFRRGDEKPNTEGYKGMIFINCKSKDKPQVIDQNLNVLTTDQEFYSGCYARAFLSAYAYDQMGNKGVAFGLQNLQKMGEGKKFSGRMNADEVFDAVEDTSENAASYETPERGEAVVDEDEAEADFGF
jgi:hypothetical protein